MSMGTGGPAILWDIDGTLLRAAGTGVRTFTIALQAVTGRGFPTTLIDMGGRTDPDIAALVLTALDIHDDEVHARLLTEVEVAYAALEHEFKPLTVAKPGVADALELLADLGAVQTIVTATWSRLPGARWRPSASTTTCVSNSGDTAAITACAPNSCVSRGCACRRRSRRSRRGYLGHR